MVASKLSTRKFTGGLLALRDDEDHQRQLERLGIREIDLVVNNLYPFVETVRSPETSLRDALENIDIGGPAMTRAAAKNHPNVVIVVDPADYERVGGMIRDGEVTQSERRRLAAKAFQHVAAYDTAVASYLREDADTGSGEDREGDLPAELTFGYSLVASPRYGENPHQSAGIYSLPGRGRWRCQRRTASRHRHVLPELLRCRCGLGQSLVRSLDLVLMPP